MTHPATTPFSTPLERITAVTALQFLKAAIERSEVDSPAEQAYWEAFSLVADDLMSEDQRDRCEEFCLTDPKPCMPDISGWIVREIHFPGFHTHTKA